jgi:predicted MPP superfamily phosphohydrolase
VAAIAADSTLIEPNRPRLVRREIRLRRWPSRLDGFTIALLSDFHYDPHFSVHPIRSAVEIVTQLRPDLVALTGDFVSASWLGSSVRGAADAEPCAELLAKLRAPHGVWAVLGNHDASAGADRVTEALDAVTIPTLSNQSVAIERNGARFWLSGVDDVLDGSPDLPSALQGIPSEDAVVLMAHEPDYADEVAGYPVDLQLSGHSHGGQVIIPFLPPLYLPPLAKKYISGQFKIGALTLYTNAGIGTVDLPVRWNCPPEVTFITLTRSSKEESRQTVKPFPEESPLCATNFTKDRSAMSYIPVRS